MFYNPSKIRRMIKNQGGCWINRWFSWVNKRRRSSQPHGPKVQWPNLCSSALVYGWLGGAVLLILRKFVYSYKTIIYMIIGMS